MRQSSANMSGLPTRSATTRSTTAETDRHGDAQQCETTVAVVNCTCSRAVVGAHGPRSLVVDRDKWFCLSFRDAGRGCVEVPRWLAGCAGELPGWAGGNPLARWRVSPWRRVVAESGGCAQARRISLRRRSGFARPYIAVLSCMMRFTVPSTRSAHGGYWAYLGCTPA